MTKVVKYFVIVVNQLVALTQIEYISKLNLHSFLF